MVIPGAAQQLADSIPAYAPTVDRAAVEVWLRRNGLTLVELQVGGIRAPRPRRYTAARRLLARFLVERGWSLGQIADLLGYADHSSIFYLLGRKRGFPTR